MYVIDDDLSTPKMKNFHVVLERGYLRGVSRTHGGDGRVIEGCSLGVVLALDRWPFCDMLSQYNC